MKKLFFLLFGLLLLTACEQESILPTTSEADSMIEGRAMKMDVCHNGNGKWQVLNISVNAWSAHQAHGDLQLIDTDDDGYVVAINACVQGGDCNDQNAAVNPGAEEVCGDGIDNDCDGQVDEGCFSYPTVVLHDKTWLAQNLDIYVPGASWCYDNDPDNCATYGRLYIWEAAKTACAQLGTGWRLPTDSEWSAMINAYGGVETNAAYDALIQGGSTGFDLLLGGYKDGYSGSFLYIGGGYYWTATESNAINAWFYNLDQGRRLMHRQEYHKNSGFSCRCIQD